MLAVVGLAFGAQAQQGGYDNYFGLTLGGGLNTMTYSPTNGENNLAIGFDAGLHYTHFFNEHIGFGFGVRYTHAHGHALYNYTEVTNGLTPAGNPNVTYNLHTTFNNWKEHQTLGLFSIPLEIFYRSIMSESWTFIAGLGAQFDLPIHGSYSGEDGDYSTSGVFPALGNYPVTNVPEQGFNTYDNTGDAELDNLGLSVSVIADLGFRVALGSNWGLYFGVYGGYGVNNMLKEQKEASLLVVNPNDPSKIDYNGTFGSNEVDAVHLLRAGIKIGIDLGWDSKSTIAERERIAAEKAAAEKAEADRIAAEKAAAERAAREKAAAEKAAQEKAAADRAAAEAAAAKAAAEREAAERAAAQAAADKAAAEAAANKAAAERAAAEREARERAERTKAEAVKQIQAINATVYFATAGTKAKFDDITDGAIHAICEALKADENLTVTVFGHTDNTGSRKANMKYGKKRAEALKKYMVKLGAPAKSIKCVSKGPDEPVADNGTKEGRAKNRRATVELKELK